MLTSFLCTSMLTVWVLMSGLVLAQTSPWSMEDVKRAKSMTDDTNTGDADARGSGSHDADADSSSPADCSALRGGFRDAELSVYDQITVAHEDSARLPDGQSVRVLCVIMTHKRRHDAARAVARTWGRRCAGFLAVSDEEDVSVPTVQTSYTGPEGWDYLWVKKVSVYRDTAAMWEAQGWANAFDFVFFGDDDTYVVVPNLHAFLADLVRNADPSGGNAVYVGAPHRINGDPSHDEYHVLYNVGGAGTVLDSVALRALITALNTDTCTAGVSASDTGQFTYEDVFTARCLAGVPGRPVVPVDSRDDKGRHRFSHIHPLDIVGDGSLTNQPPQWVYWYQTTMVGHQKGLGAAGVSPHIVTWHDVKNPHKLEAVDAYLVQGCMLRHSSSEL